MKPMLLMVVSVVAMVALVLFWPAVISASIRSDLINLPLGSITGSWIERFQISGVITCSISVILAVLWYILGAFVLDGPNLALWVFMAMVSVLSTLIPPIFVLNLLRVSNQWLVMLILLANNFILAFWISTLVSSPNTVQMSVPLAKVIRPPRPD